MLLRNLLIYLPIHLGNKPRLTVLKWFANLCRAYLGDELIRRHATIGKHVRCLVPFFEFLFLSDRMSVDCLLSTSENVEAYVPHLLSSSTARASRKNMINTLLGAVSAFQTWELAYRSLHETAQEVSSIYHIIRS